MPKTIVKLFLFIAFASTVLITVNTSNAQTTYTSIDEHIVSFHSKVQINKDGTIDVTEQIAYDFGPNRRHGIYRDIPFIKTNSQGKKFKLDIYDISANEQATISNVGDNVKIKIGDPNKTITGKKSYEISYKVKGALTYFSDHDELYWNLTGNAWQVPIDQFIGEIAYPSDVKADQVNANCYTGALGATETSCTISNSSGKVVITSNSKLDINQGVTVVFGFPKNVVEVLEPKPYFDYSSLLWVIFFIYPTISIYVYASVIMAWLKDRVETNKKQKIVAAWFEPPHLNDGCNFSPAQTAFIVNRSVDYRQITGAIIYLAQKGFLKIKVDESNFGPFKNQTITLIKKIDWQNSNELGSADKYLLDILFSSGNISTVTNKELAVSTSFASKANKYLQKVGQSLYSEGMFLQDPQKHKLKTLAKMVLTIVGIISVPFLGVILLILGWFNWKKTLLRTDKGIEKYSEAQSLLNFLKSQEEQLEFQAHNQMFFEKLLPYATAFGVEKIWAKRFSDLQFTQNNWYEGSNLNALTYINTMQIMNTSFRSMTTTNSSSGFSSGFSGGHSGGGGGGGGGGSW